MCFDWFAKARSQNIPISGPIVKAKAREIAQQMGYSAFSASDGWLQKWRRRHNITFKRIAGEASDVSQVDVDQFKAKLPSILLGYPPEDIYNADESGIFFRALPDKTFALKSDKCIGGKLSKERLTILFCVNMAGEKEMLLVIGKAARPRAFKNLLIKDLPANWKSNRKAWMTREIMSEWLQQFDKKMRSQKRKVLLFLDNAASHPRDLNLTNVNIIFLPANTTAVCQPLDQGIIQNFKVHYRGFILKHILSKMDAANSASQLARCINVFEALYFIKASWDKVEAATIKNCFRKAAFVRDNCILPEFDAEDELPLSTLLNLQNGFAELSDKNLEEFLNIDEAVHTEDHDIEIPLENENDTMEVNDSEDEVNDQVPDSIKSYDEALKQIARLKRFARDDFIAFQHLKKLESHFENHQLKWKQSTFQQTKIYNFFQPM